MANQNNSQNPKGWGKVVAWYARNAYMVNIIYSAGASVVIIGALFKILHWPGASYVLMVGMFTESFLFMLGIFEKPHVVYNWENIFPQIVGHEKKELFANDTLPGKKTDALDAAIPEAELKALKEGIKKLGQTAEQVASLGQVAGATDTLTANITKASEAAKQFANSQEALVKNSESLGTSYDELGKSYQTILQDMENVIKETKTYGKSTEELNAQIASLNSVYELQLKEINAQANAFRAQTEKIEGVSATVEQMAQEAKQLQAITAETLEAGKQYQSAQQKLAQQVADLNKVYGNMLNALS